PPAAAPHQPLRTIRRRLNRSPGSASSCERWQDGPMQPARGTLRRSLMAAAGSLLAMAAGATAEPRRPLVLLPGITGTALVDREDGTVAWGRGLRLLLPRDRGHALALPDRPADRRLTPGAVIEFLRIYGVYRFEVYGPLFEAFEAAGYRRGDLRNPRADA